MTNPTTRPCPDGPFGTVALFDLGAGADLARYRFYCALCATNGVDEAGELCADCADAVLTDRINPATKTTKPTRTRRRAG